jgi:CRISPR-associated protein Csd1
VILQALNNYYYRLKDNPDIDIPLQGFSRQKIHFALIIDQKGKLIQIRDIREQVGKKILPKSLIVPAATIRAVNISANFLWDNTGYVLGSDLKDDSVRASLTFKAFKELHHIIGDELNDDGMIAVLRFLDSWKPASVTELQYWEDFKTGANLIFQLDGELRYIHERPEIRKAWLTYLCTNQSTHKDFCLVTGEIQPISRLHPKIKGVRDAQSMGAAIVSFNLDAFCSYQKEQNFNAPIGEEATFNYTTALNHLLGISSRQRIQIGDATTVFWTERASPIEGFMGMVLNPQDDAGEIKEVRAFLEAARDGKNLPEIDPGLGFYILGLSPNASRLSVRFWYVSTVGDISEKIGQHFRDLSIVKQYENDPEFPGIRQILLETFINHKSKTKPNWDNLKPLLTGSIMRSILTGTQYPYTLLTAIIGRIRADQTINYFRAAIIKGFLSRKNRITNHGQEVSMSLDKESTNIAYRLGRLFAILEKAQRDAIPGANATIKDRYYSSASATPRVVFPQLLRLAQHHIQKAEYGGRSDKMIEDIMQGINTFPTHLSLDDQGMFAIGYYHQRNALFTKSENQKEV